MLSSYCKKRKLTAWGPCVSRFAFTFKAFPVIVRDADCLFASRKVFWFTSTLFSYTTRTPEEKMCHKWPERYLVWNCANSSFSSFILKQETIILSLDNNDWDIMGCGMLQKKRGLRFDESPHLLESQQAAKRAVITIDHFHKWRCILLSHCVYVN